MIRRAVLFAALPLMVAGVHAATWTTAGAGTLPQAVRNAAAAVLSDGRFMVVGGTVGGIDFKTVQIYDPVNGSWSQKHSMSVARSSATASALPDGTLLVLGGENGLASFEIYNPFVDQWSTGIQNPLNPPVANQTATWLQNNSIFFAGGANAGVSLSSASVYLFGSGSMTTGGTLLQARSRHTTTRLPNGSVLSAGGVAGGLALSSAELNGVLVGSLATARYDHRAILLPTGKVLVAGGTTNGSNALASAELFDPVGKTWSSAGSMSSPRRGFTMTLLPNGTVIAVGGFDGSSFLSSTDIYDPSSGLWSAGPSLSQARGQHVASLLVNGKLLVAGGTIDGYNALNSVELLVDTVGAWAAAGTALKTQFAGTALLPDGRLLMTGGLIIAGQNPLSSSMIYDTASGQWTTAASMNNSRTGHTLTLLPTGQILAASGLTDGVTFTPTAELYDPIANTWNLTASMAVAREDAVAVLLPKSKVLVSGGFVAGTNGPGLASAEIYDAATGAWSAATSMSTPRVAQTATFLPSGLVLIAGGSTSDFNGTVLASAETFNPATGQWSAASSMLTARETHTATLMQNGQVLVTGGLPSVSGAPLATAEVYDPQQDTWTAVGSMSTARWSHEAALLPNGRVLICGGINTSSTILSSCEVYDPATGQFAPALSMSNARNAHHLTRMGDGTVVATGGGAAAAEKIPYTEYAFPTAAVPVVASINGLSSFPINLGKNTFMDTKGTGFLAASEGNSPPTGTDLPHLYLAPDVGASAGPNEASGAFFDLTESINTSPPPTPTEFTVVFGPNLNAGYYSYWVSNNGVPALFRRVLNGAVTPPSSQPPPSAAGAGPEAHAYPVPFVPSHGDQQITFTNLVPPGQITVYTVNGEEVWSQGEPTGASQLGWTVQNRHGQTVVSGVYLFVVKDAAGTSRGKLVIVR